MILFLLGIIVALVCLCSVYGICHQLRHRLWDDLRETWWFYLGTFVVCALFLALI